MNEADQQPSFTTVLKRGLRMKCPRCGQSTLFYHYMTAHINCNICKLDFGSLRADDGPAWLTIIIAGHLGIPFVFWLLERDLSNPIWDTILPIAFVIALSLIILPRAKGLFIAMIWYKDNRDDDEPTL